MTESELKKLSRVDLLEMLIEQSKQLKEVQDRLEKTENELKSREIAINEAGSIAEASLRLNGVFEAAQAAGQQYLANIELLSKRQELVCSQLERESREKADQLIDEAMRKSSEMEDETRRRCDDMVEDARRKSQAYWDEVSARLDEFFVKYSDLKELLSGIPKKQ